MASWRAILRHPEAPKVRCVGEWVVGRPGLAIVVCREILPEGQLMATNTFARLERRLAHDRPSFGAGAGDRDRADDGGAGVGTDARPAQAALAPDSSDHANVSMHASVWRAVAQQCKHSR